VDDEDDNDGYNEDDDDTEDGWDSKGKCKKHHNWKQKFEKHKHRHCES
jgi:hypothetical protein